MMIQSQKKRYLGFLLSFIFLSAFSQEKIHHYKIDNTSVTATVYGPVYDGKIYTSLWKSDDNPDSTPCAIILSPKGKKVLYKKRGPYFTFFPLINDMYCLCAFVKHKNQKKGFEWILLNNKFQKVNTYSLSSKRLLNDQHECVLKENGNILLLGREKKYDKETKTIYVNRVLQEITPQHKVVFEWSTNNLLTKKEILHSPCRHGSLVDYAHSNSIWIDNDGHYLLSHRKLCEITKIDSNTGQILWRLGGPHNQFTFVDDILQGPSFQHHVSRLENNNILMFDNRQVSPSRIIEYAIDEEDKTATLIWEYTLDCYCDCMGSAQRLPNGNTLISLRETKGPFSKILEVTPQKEKVLEITVPKSDGVTIYRAYKK